MSELSGYAPAVVELSAENLYGCVVSSRQNDDLPPDPAVAHFNNPKSDTSVEAKLLFAFRRLQEEVRDLKSTLGVQGIRLTQTERKVWAIERGDL